MALNLFLAVKAVEETLYSSVAYGIVVILILALGMLLPLDALAKIVRGALNDINYMAQFVKSI